MAKRIFLIDEHPEESAALAAYLGSNGFIAEVWSEPEPMLRRLADSPPWLVLFQRRVRGQLGLQLLRRIRAASAVPLILRAIGGDDELDRILALEIGADDYVPSGMSTRELLARIRCVLRRSRGLAASAESAPSHRWRLCVEQRELFGPDGQPRHLTAAEFELLQLLVRAQGTPVPRETMSQAVLRRPYHPEDRALDNLVLRLRRKLEDENSSTPIIKAVRGVGYVFIGFAKAESAATDYTNVRPDISQHASGRVSLVL
jgi:DNA-binding response OmpR family regulator